MLHVTIWYQLENWNITALPCINRRKVRAAATTYARVSEIKKTSEVPLTKMSVSRTALELLIRYCYTHFYCIPHKWNSALRAF